MGYHLAGFEVTGVDIEPQKRYPFHFVQGDALTFPLEGYDLIHASPPCQRYSVTHSRHGRKEMYSDLLPLVRERLIESGKPYVIENVPNAPMKNFVMLCGSMFDLGVRRHRWFETSISLAFSPLACRHDYKPVIACGNTSSKANMSKAMEIDWMSHTGLTQAIPPAYTKWIGEQFLHFL